jgi:hypothetical protein
MLTLVGQVMNVFHTAGGTDKKTGEVIEPRAKVQIMGSIPMQNGEERNEMFDLTTDRPHSFKVAKGKKVRVPVQLWVIDGNAGIYTPRGVEIELIDDNGKKIGLIEEDKPQGKRAA